MAKKKRQRATPGLQQIADVAKKVAVAAETHQKTQTAKSRRDLHTHVQRMQTLMAGSKDLGPLMAQAAAAKAAEPTSVPMNEFFGNVGQALMNAQKTLDVESANYLVSAATQKHVLKSVFRIPKLSAELKFAIDKIEAKGVNLFIYKDQTQAQTLNQQTVQFDIVSIPPPPDLLPAPFQMNPVLAKDQRAKILGTVSANPWGRNADSVLIHEIVSGQYLLAYAIDGKGNVAFWYLVADPSTVAALRAFGPENGEAVEPARKTIQSLGAKQKEFLSNF